MTNDDLRAIGNIVEQKIEKALEPVHKKLDAHSAKLDNHTASLMNIEATLEGYADMYKVNKDKNNELSERVSAIEENLAINPQK